MFLVFLHLCANNEESPNHMNKNLRALGDFFNEHVINTLVQMTMKEKIAVQDKHAAEIFRKCSSCFSAWRKHLHT